MFEYEIFDALTESMMCVIIRQVLLHKMPDIPKIGARRKRKMVDTPACNNILNAHFNSVRSRVAVFSNADPFLLRRWMFSTFVGNTDIPGNTDLERVTLVP